MLNNNLMNNYPDPNSIVDSLKVRDINSSFDARKVMYENIFGGDYRGTPDQNVRFNSFVKDFW